MVYQFKDGARIKADAQTVGDICESLEHNGGLTAKRLLDESRPEESPLHKEFEWDDATAAECYRESQAAYIIRHITVVTVPSGEAPRAFHSVTVNGENKEYVSLNVIVSKPDLYKQLVEEAKKDFDAYRKKYSAIKALETALQDFENIVNGLEYLIDGAEAK